MIYNGLNSVIITWSYTGGGLFAGYFILRILSSLVALVSFETAFEVERIQLYAMMILVVIATAVALLAFGFTVAGQIRAKTISRQTTLTGKSTYKMLRDAVDKIDLHDELSSCILKPAEAASGNEDVKA